MEGQAEKEHYEQVVSVPEHLKIGPPAKGSRGGEGGREGEGILFDEWTRGGQQGT